MAAGNVGTALGDEAGSLLAVEYYLDGRYQSSLATANQNKTRFGNTAKEQLALVVLFDTYLYGLGNKESAQAAFNELSSKYPNAAIIRRLQYELAGASSQQVVKQTVNHNVQTVVPQSLSLEQNYPNPFNPQTSIKYQITTAAKVTLKIYNLRGREIRTLVDEFQQAGTHEIRWNGKDASGRSVGSGVYLYRLQAGDLVQVNKMTFLK